MECDIEDKFLRIRDENLLLKKQINEANNNIKLLTTRLNRLLEMKKRALTNEKSKKLVSMEEIIFNLQLKIGQLESENRKFRQRSLLLQTKLDAIRRRQYRSMYSSVPSRTDSGLEWIDSASSHFNSKPSSARLTVHHRSSSTISLNRVTFNASNHPIQNLPYHSSGDGRVNTSNNSIKPIEEKSKGLSNINKKGHQRASSGSHLHRESVIAGNNGDKLIGKNDFVLQLLRETQEEVGRLQEIIVLQQHYIDNLQSDVQGINNGQDHVVNGLIKSTKESTEAITETRKQAIESSSTTLLELGNHSPTHSVNGDTAEVNYNDTQKILQVFKMSNGSIDLDKILSSTKGIPNEIILQFEKLTTELVESQNIIKSLRSQLFKDNLATVKIVEMNQKLDHLTQENEILQKSLQNCIGTCISGLEKDFDDNEELVGKTLESSESDSNSKIIKHLQNKIKRLVGENTRQTLSLEEKTQLINLLQVKYNNLKDAYDLIISSSRSPLSKSSSLQSTASTSPKMSKNDSRLSTSFTFTDSNDHDRLIVNDDDKFSHEKLQLFKGDQNQKGVILDSLGHVREMVNSVQSELEIGLKLDDYHED